MRASTRLRSSRTRMGKVSVKIDERIGGIKEIEAACGNDKLLKSLDLEI